MNKSDYLDKRIPPDAGEPDNFDPYQEAEEFQQVMDQWWVFLDADQEYIKKQENEPAPF